MQAQGRGWRERGEEEPEAGRGREEEGDGGTRRERGARGAGQGEEEARQATQEVAASVTLTLVSHRMELRLF